MDIATIVGLIAAFSFIMVGIGANIEVILNAPSFIIVIGGTMAATLVAFPLADVIQIVGLVLRYAIVPPRPLNAFAIRYRLTGEEDSEAVIAQAGPQPTPEEIVRYQKHLKLGVLMFDRMKMFAQAFGWIGVLIGLVIMLKNMSDPAAIGPGMAICLLTALYGTIIGFVICLPIKTKFERYLMMLPSSE